MPTTPKDVLEYWFGPMDQPGYPENRSEMWWKKNPDVDAEILSKFGATCEASARGELEGWRETKEGRLAHIILIDQMARNMHRGSADMFAQDALGQELALLCLMSDEFYPGYHERMFQYMPLMHAETLSLQRLCVHLFQREIDMAQTEEVKEAAVNNHDYAVRHMVIVERFGRFPHRNEVLGRDSTPEEIEFLKEPGSSF